MFNQFFRVVKCTRLRFALIIYSLIYVCAIFEGKSCSIPCVVVVVVIIMGQFLSSFFFYPYPSSSVTASMRRASFFSLSRVEQIVPDSRTRPVSNGFLEGWLALFVRRESLPDHSSVFTVDCVDTPLEYAPRLCSLWSALCARWFEIKPLKIREVVLARERQIWHGEITTSPKLAGKGICL